MKLESLKNGKFQDKVLKSELNKLFGGQSTVKTSSTSTKSNGCSDVSTVTTKENGDKSYCTTYDCPDTPAVSDTTAVK